MSVLVLAGSATLIGVLLATAPLYWLLLVDFASVLLSQGGEIGGVSLDVSDLTMVGVCAAIALRRNWRAQILKIPHLRLWLMLVLLESLVYLHAPVNQPYLTSPAAVIYQLYRYAWKPLLYYPIPYLLLTNGNSMKNLLVAFVVAADLISMQAIVQGYAGDVARGPFSTHNGLGGALVIPFILSLFGAVYPSSRLSMIAHGGSALLIMRALTLAGSRGAFVAMMAGMAVLLALLWRSSRERPRAIRMVGALAAIALLTVAAKPDILERPTVKHILSIGQTTEVSNFRWRYEQRWPHFWNRAWESPWLGHGTHVDKAFGEHGNTPHNGYLAVAVHSGFPSFFLMAALLYASLRGTYSVVRHSADHRSRVVAIGLTAALVAFLTHNLVESLIFVEFPAKLFWTVVAMGAALEHKAGFAAVAKRKRIRVATRLEPIAAGS